MTQIVRGDQKPDLQITLSDAAGAATFASVTPAQVRIVAEQDGTVVIDGPPDSVTPSTDGSTAVVRRAWADGDTDTAGRMWISVVVEWSGADPQTFPANGPLRLDIARAAGDI